MPEGRRLIIKTRRLNNRFDGAENPHRRGFARCRVARRKDVGKITGGARASLADDAVEIKDQIAFNGVGDSLPHQKAGDAPCAAWARLVKR